MLAKSRKLKQDGFEFVSENQTTIIISQYFLCFSLDRTIWKKSRHCQFDWVCAAHIEYRFVVLKNVRITGICISKN